MTWNPSPDPAVVGYLFHSRVLGSFNGPVLESRGPDIIKVGPNTRVTLTNVQTGVAYLFYVTAYSSLGTESDPSNKIVYTPGGLPAGSTGVSNAPSSLRAIPAGTYQVTLMWKDNSTNEDGFIIERSLDGASFTAIDTAGPDVTNYTVDVAARFPADTYPYWFRVSAFRGALVSSWSNPTTAITNQADLELISLSAAPANPVERTPVRFSATLTNAGLAASPQGVPVRVSFYINGGTPVSWAHTSDSIPPGGTLTLTANGGPDGQSTWTAIAGFFPFSATVGDPGHPAGTNGTVRSFNSALLVTPAPVPAITLSLSRTNITERDAAGCVVTITRTGDTTAAMSLRITLGGTAINRRDYNLVVRSLEIPAGTNATTMVITPVDDIRITGTKTISLAVLPVGASPTEIPGTATLFIEDTDVDSDGDGMSDREELLAGTDPNDPTSNLRILWVWPSAPDEWVVMWSSVPGRSYQVLAKDLPGPADWTVASASITATAAVTRWTDKSGNNTRFYRISLVTP